MAFVEAHWFCKDSIVDLCVRGLLKVNKGFSGVVTSKVPNKEVFLGIISFQTYRSPFLEPHLLSREASITSALGQPRGTKLPTWAVRVLACSSDILGATCCRAPKEAALESVLSPQTYYGFPLEPHLLKSCSSLSFNEPSTNFQAPGSCTVSV